MNSVPPDCKPFGHADTYKKGCQGMISFVNFFHLTFFISYVKNIFLRPIRTPSDIPDARDFSCVVFSVALAVGRSPAQGIQAIIK